VWSVRRCRLSSAAQLHITMECGWGRRRAPGSMEPATGAGRPGGQWSRGGPGGSSPGQAWGEGGPSCGRYLDLRRAAGPIRGGWRHAPRVVCPPGHGGVSYQAERQRGNGEWRRKRRPGYIEEGGRRDGVRMEPRGFGPSSVHWADAASNASLEQSGDCISRVISSL